MGAKGKVQAIRQIIWELNEIVSSLDGSAVAKRQAIPHPESASGPIDDEALRLIAIGIYKRRRIRDKLFPHDLFSEPAWDMILDLFINKVNGRRPRVKSVCIASCAPMSTALRWIGLLESEGFLVRGPDEKDKRSQLLELSEMGLATVRRFLTKIGNLESNPSML